MQHTALLHLLRTSGKRSRAQLADFPDGKGGSTPAVIQSTKRGQVFVLDRRTGQPLVEVVEKPVIVPAVKALDRVLLWGFYVVPQWHSRVFRLAFWDIFGRPERAPRFGIALNAWWIDAAKAARINALRR